MNDLKHLLIVFAGLLIINVVLSGLLWARYRTPQYRALFWLWAFGILSAASQALVQSDRWMVFAFGFGSFPMALLLADLVGRALNLPTRARVYGVAFLVGLLASAVATWASAPFWVRALPMAVGSSLAVVDISFRSLWLPRQAISTTGHAAIVATTFLALHQLDYPFLRDDPRFATLGFVIGILTVFAISVSAPAVILEHTAGEVKRLNQQLEARIEDALSAVRSRDEFLAIAAHEIRGPINALHLAIQTLRKGKVPDAAVPKMFDVVERADRRLAQFVNELLDVGRMQAGKLELELERVDLIEVVREVAAQVGPEIARSGSELSIAADAEVVGCWDKFRLAQVVNNLLTNALKFGLGKPIQMSISAREGVAMLVVADRGVGIPPALCERIFDAFERGVSVRHYGGLGLGLHIARTIVSALGGTITVVSEPGSGSTFTVVLPVERRA